ncbi:MAG: tryptophan-rich sensory protein [Pseudorhodobacter sp.]|nr:tryptophan-rich sensory protein [Pseudorhodobacter sp.]
MTPREKLITAAFIFGVIAAGSLIGASFTPGEWYRSLVRPSWTPPNWVFGPVWTVLYGMIGFVGARKWLRGGAWSLWLIQLAVNLSWSPIFFGLNLPATAFVVIALTTGLVAAFILREWPKDRLSAAMMLPYLVWLIYASTVNAGVVWLN